MTQRVIYSREVELDPGPGPQSKVLICPLDRDGNTEHAYVLGKHRMIDVRIGDTVQHAKGRWRILGVRAWRDCRFPANESPPSDGYLVRI